VAIIGSIFATTYGPKIIELLGGLSLPKEAIAAAEQSVGAAFMVAEQAGDPMASQAIRDIAGTSFLDGFQVACTTVGVVAILGALLAYRFLPARKTAPEPG